MVMQLIDALASSKTPDRVNNQYATTFHLDLSQEDAAAGRKIRLAQHLSCEPKLILLHSGCGKGAMHGKWSGIPCTTEELVMRGKIPRVFSTRFTCAPVPHDNWKVAAIWGELATFGLERDTIQWAVQPFIAPSLGALTFEQAQQSCEVNFGIQFLELLLQHFKGVPIIAFSGVAAGFLSKLGITPAATCALGASDDIKPFSTALQYFVNEPWRDEIKRIKADETTSSKEKAKLLIHLGGFTTITSKEQPKKERVIPARRVTTRARPVKRTSKRIKPEPLPLSTVNVQYSPPAQPVAVIKVELGEVLKGPRQNKKAIQEVKDFFVQCRDKSLAA